MLTLLADAPAKNLLFERLKSWAFCFIVVNYIEKMDRFTQEDFDRYLRELKIKEYW